MHHRRSHAHASRASAARAGRTASAATLAATGAAEAALFTSLLTKAEEMRIHPVIAFAAAAAVAIGVAKLATASPTHHAAVVHNSPSKGL